MFAVGTWENVHILAAGTCESLHMFAAGTCDDSGVTSNSGPPCKIFKMGPLQPKTT